MQFEEILVTSTMDGSVEASHFAKSDLEGKRPLLVFLHTWSYDKDNQKKRLPYAEKRGFHLLLPEFRGSNTKKNPRANEACGSILARTDIKDAIDYVVEHYEVDTDNIFIVGCSGGGHMALLMAGFIPEYFRAVAAFVPITNLVTWAEYSAHYGELVMHCCGTEDEALLRSPVSYIDNIAKANVKVFAGRYDNVVPYRQTLDFYLALTEKYPDAKMYIDIFDGGHEYRESLADEWLMSQYKKKCEEVTG